MSAIKYSKDVAWLRRGIRRGGLRPLKLCPDDHFAEPQPQLLLKL
jgi:hypothetical protein